METEEHPSASLLETVQFNRLVVVPNALQGLFKRRPGPVSIATKLGVEDAGIRFLASLRKKYEGRPVWTRLGGDEALLLLSVDDVRHVLEHSPDLFASDPPGKRKGMAHFQPHALTLSRGELWRDRRAFAEHVLETPEPAHSLADGFVAIVAEEVATLLAEVRAQEDGRLEWPAWHRAMRRVVRRVVLGDAAAGDEELTDMLAKLMGEANSMPGDEDGPSPLLQEFEDRMGSYVHGGDAGGLAALVGGAPSSERTEVVGQLTHWMFATGDTLPANALRALAATVAHPEPLSRVRAEIAGAGDPLTGKDVVAMAWVRGCLQDTMRLWPTTPLLSREALREVSVGGGWVPKGAQIVIANAFHHRDRETVPYADRFAPDEWVDGDAPSRWDFNHFSHGPQGCPGTNLALLLGGAAFAALLGDAQVSLAAPRLDVAKPLPAAFDFHAIRLQVS